MTNWRANLQRGQQPIAPNVRGNQGRAVMGEEDGDDIYDFDDHATVDMRERDNRRARRIDRDLGSIKLKIPSFQGKNDPEVYLEWKKKVELVFDCYNYSEEKKGKTRCCWIYLLFYYLVGSTCFE